MSKLEQLHVETLKNLASTTWHLSCTGICNVSFVLIWQQQQRQPLQYRWQLAHLHMPGLPVISHWSSLNISDGRIDLQSKAMTGLGAMNIEYA